MLPVRKTQMIQTKHQPYRAATRRSGLPTHFSEVK